MLRQGTKNHFERENEEADRLVRPAPKVKPPRHDKRRERVEPDTDPDLENKDPDMSMNYKDIGGSSGGRVLTRWLARQADDEANKVRVKKKDTGWVGLVNKETLKQSPSDYEVVDKDDDEEAGDDKGGAPEEPKPKEPDAPEKPEEGPQAPSKDEHQVVLEFRDELRGDPALASFVKGLLPKGSMEGWPDETPVAKLPKQLLSKFPTLQKFPELKTLGDVRKTFLKAKGVKGPSKSKGAPAPQPGDQKQQAPAPKQEGKPPEPKGEPPVVDPEKQKAVADAGQQVRELAEKDPAIKTVLQQLDGQDDKTLYKLRQQINPTEDISKSIPGLPPSIKSIGDLVDAVKATKPAEKPEEKGKEKEEEKGGDDAIVQRVLDTLQKSLGVSPKEEMHPDDKAEAEEFVKSKGHETPEFAQWAKDEPSIQDGKDGKPLFYDEKRRKHVPFDKLGPEEQYAWKERFDDHQKLVNNLKPLKVPPPRRRKFTQAEKDKADRQIIENFPTEVAEKFLDAEPPIHPDDVRDLVEHYNTAKLHSKDGELSSLVKETGYETNPDKVRPPQMGVDKHGQEVPFTQLPPQEQAEAMQKHRMFVVAMSLAAREKEVASLEKKTGAPKELLGAIADMSLNQRPGETPEERETRGRAAAKAVFGDAVKRGLMTSDADAHVRWEQKRNKLIEQHRQEAKDSDEEYDESKDDLPSPPPPKGMSDKQLKKVLDHFKDDPAAQSLAVGYSQATDYLAARDKFLDHNSGESFSEHNTPGDIARGVAHMGQFFDNRSKRYPEGLRDIVDAKAHLRDQAVEKIRTLAPEKFPIVKKLVQEQEYDDYDTQLAIWNHKYDKFKAKSKPKKKDHPYRDQDEPEPEFPPPPQRPEGYLQSRGDKKDLKSDKNELFDKYRRQMGVPGGAEKTAHLLWTVVDRYLKYSTCAAPKTMGDPLSVRVAERAKESVYWGVAPYPKGHEGFAPYTKWEQAHQRDLGDKDFDTILKAAREWLKAPVLASAVEGIYRDTQLRAALDLAIRDCEKGKYSVGLQPPLYNMLLARLGGASPNETLLTDRSNIKGPITTNASIGSLYAPTGVENPMKASALIRQVAAKYASSNPALAYDLIDLADKVAQDDQGQGQAQQDQKQGGEIPPQFLEHMKKKEDGKKDEKKDEGQGQQKDASYQSLRAAVIRTAAANPQLRPAYLPLLETIKKLG